MLTRQILINKFENIFLAVRFTSSTITVGNDPQVSGWDGSDH